MRAPIHLVAVAVVLVLGLLHDSPVYAASDEMWMIHNWDRDEIVNGYFDYEGNLFGYIFIDDENLGIGQEFTTGPNPDGYLLTHFNIGTNNWNDATADAVFVAGIWHVDANGRSDLVTYMYTLDTYTDDDWIWTPADVEVLLQPDTRYMFTLECRFGCGPSQGGFLHLYTTPDDMDNDHLTTFWFPGSCENHRGTLTTCNDYPRENWNGWEIENHLVTQANGWVHDGEEEDTLILEAKAKLLLKPHTPEGLTAEPVSGDPGKVFLAWTSPWSPVPWPDRPLDLPCCHGLPPPAPIREPITHREFRYKLTDAQEWGEWTEIPFSSVGELHANQYTVSGLTSGVPYDFQVRAVNGDGARSHSNTASAEPGLGSGICDRTREVRNAILKKIGQVSDCGGVTGYHMGRVTGAVGVTDVLESLKPGDLEGLVLVTELDLSGGALKQLPAGIFDDLRSVTRLNLSGNQLTDLPSGVFDKMSTLEALDLRHNDLTGGLPAGLLRELTALKELFLGSNNLVNRDLLTLLFNLAALETVGFGHNRLTELPIHLFLGRINLRAVYLRGNAVDPMVLPISLESDAESGVRVVMPTGAPFPITVQVDVTGGELEAGGNALVLPTGHRFGEYYSLKPNTGATEDPVVTMQSLPDLPMYHSGYVLRDPDAQPVEKVTGVVVSARELALQVGWSAVAGATGYKVQWKSGAETFADAATGHRERALSGGATVADTIPGLVAGTEYTVRVIGVKAGAADGAPSDEKTGTPLAATAPVLDTATVDGATLALTYNETLDGASVPAASAYTVKVGGSAVNLVATGPVAVSGKVVTLTLAAAVEAGDTVTVSYTAPGSGPVQDEDGHAAGNLTEQAVDNLTNAAATGKPAVTGTAQVGQTLAAGRGDIADGNGLPGTFPDDYRFQWYRVDSDGSSNRSGITGATSGTYTLAAAEQGKKVIVAVSFTDADGHAETVESDAYPALGAVAAPDTTAPALASAAVDGAALALTFDEVLAAAPNLANDAFTVAVNGTAAALGGTPVIGGAVVALTLAAAVEADAVVTVSYGKPATGAGNKLQDASGNEVADFTDQAVTNATAPGKVTGVVVSARELALQVGWSAVAGATGYKVQWKSGAETFADAATGHRERALSGGATVADTIPGLVAGTEYTVRVIGVKAGAADGAPSDEKTGTPLAATAPVLDTATVDGATLALTYNETLDGASVPAASAYTVKVGGSAVNLVATGPVAVSGKVVTLTLAAAVEAGDTVTVSYTAPGSGPVQDEDGHAAGNLTEQAVDNLTNAAATGKPAVTGTAQVGQTLAAGRGDIADGNGLPGTFPDDYRFQWYRVDSDGSSNRSGITGATSGTYTLAAAEQGKKVIVAVSFTDADGHPETVESDAYPALGAVAAPDTTAPALASAAVDGAALALTFDEVLAAAPNLANDAFTVAVNGTAAALGGTPVIGGAVVALTLAAAVEADAVVTVSYGKPATGAGNKLQDASGNEVADFTDQAVTNATAPGKVTGVVVSARELALQVGWSAVAGATGYKVQWKSGAETFADAATGHRERALSGGATVADTIPGLVAGTEYTVRVIGVKAGAADGAPSDEKTGTPLAATAPVLDTATVDGATLALTYNETLDGASVPAASAYTVKVGGSAVNLVATGPVAVSGKVVTLTLAAAVEAGDTVTVSYTAPGSGPVQDEDGHAAGNLTEQAVDNLTNAAATGKPAVTGTAQVGQTLAAGRGDIADGNGLPGTFPDDYRFQWYRVDSDGSSNRSGITGATSGTYTLAAAEQGKKVIVAVSFTDADGHAETVESDAYPALGAVAAPDTTAPALASAAVDGAALALTFDEVLAAAPNLANDAFTVAVNGTAAALGGTPVIGGAVVALTLAAAVEADAVVTVSYGKPATGAGNKLQDASGNEVADFTDQAVTNATAPGKVTGVVVSARELALQVGWSAVAGATGYKVQWKSGAETFADAATGHRERALSGGATVADTIPGLVAGTEYTVRVIGVKAGAADGAPSDEKTGTPLAATAPVLDTATVDGATLALTYNETLDGASVPAASAYTVKVGGSAVNLVATGPVAVSGKVVTLTLAAAVEAGDTVTVSYTAPGSGPVQDEDGHAAGNLTEQAVDNLTNAAATGKPAVTGTAQVGQTLAAGRGDIADGNGLPGTFPDDYRFQWYRVDSDGSSNRSGITGATSGTYTLAAAEQGKKVIVAVSFTDADGHAETVESDAYPALGAVAAPDTTAPALASAAVDGAALALTFDEVLAAAPNLANDAFTVAVNGTAAALGGTPVIGGAVVALTLAAAVEADAVVTVSYGKPATGAGNKLQDASGNEVADFTDQAVTNATAPGKVTGVVVSARELALQVGWSAVAGATGYKVQWKSGAETFADAATGHRERALSGGATVADTIPGLVAGTEYTVRVIGVKAGAADGAPSDEKTGTPLAATAPVLDTATVDGATLALTYNETLDGASVPAASAYTVKVGGSAVNLVATGPVAVSGKVVTLTLAAAVEAGDTVTVSYTAPGSGPVQDEDGHAAGNLTEQAVDNLTNAAATGKPAVTGTAQVGQTLAAGRGDIADGNGLPGTFPDDYRFQWYRVDSDGSSNRSGITGATSGTYTLAAAEQGKKVIVAVSFTDADGHAETVESDAYPALGAVAAPDTTAPALASAAVDGAALALTFDEVLAAAPNLANDAFTVAVNGTAAALGGTPVIGGAVVALTLAAAVEADAVVTVSYGKPATGAGNKLQDASGNEVADFTDQAVTNATAPGKVTGVVVSARELALQVGWSAVAGATGYKVQWKSGAETFADAATGHRERALSGGATVADTIPGLVAGTEYTVRVIGVKAGAADGAPSDEKTGTPLAATAPVLDTATVDGATLALTYNETLDGASVPAASAYTVKVGGSAVNLVATGPVAVSGKVVTLTLAAAVEAGDTVTVSYTAPGSGPVQDEDGHAAGNLTEQAVDNLTNAAATGKPAVTGTAQVGQTLAAGRGDIADGNGLPGTFPDDYRFQWYRVDSDGSSNRSGITGATSGTYTLAAAEQGKKVIVAVSFTDADGHAETVESDAYPALGAVAAPDTTAPALASAAVDGAALALTFDEVLAAAPNLANDAFTVAVNGTAAALGGTPVIGGAVVALTLAAAVEADAVVTVSYGKPATGAGNKLQDASGNEVADFTDQAVTNNTEDTTIPGDGCTEGSMRLRNGNTTNTYQEGRLEICAVPPDSGAIWGTVCDDYWTDEEAQIACTAMGYAGAEAGGGRFLRSHFGWEAGDPPILLDDLVCFGDEASLLDCPVSPGGVARNNVGVHNCRERTETVGVRCLVDAGGEQLDRLRAVNSVPPPGLSVADAEAQEGAGARLDFAVTLDRAAAQAVTVDYATADGTATAGEDYTAARGTLKFAAGDTEQTIRVTVLDDSHNEGSETLMLLLVSASGADIDDGDATGTIINSDPLPKGWLARFGRTSATQVLGLLDNRFDEAAAPMSQLTLGGRRIRLLGGQAGRERPDPAQSGSGRQATEDTERTEKTERTERTEKTGNTGSTGNTKNTRNTGDTASFVRLGGAGERSVAGGAEVAAGHQPGPAWRSAGAGPADGYGPAPAHPGGAVADLNGTPAGRVGPPNLIERAAWALLTKRGSLWDVDRRRFLSQSSFDLSLTDLYQGADAGAAQNAGHGRLQPAGRWSLWGRGALTHFGGRDREVQIDGDVLTGVLGLDYRTARRLTGLALSWSDGGGRYRSDVDSGTVDSRLAGVYPYGRYALNDALSVWGVAGYGRGEMGLQQTGGGARGRDAIKTGIGMGMGAVGIRGIVHASEATELAVKSDFLFVRTSSKATEGMVGVAGADASRLRLLLSGRHRRLLANDALLTPDFELGLRYDGGAAETGFGLELGGGLRYADPLPGWTLETRARGLIAHEDGGYEEWGLSGSVQVDPGRAGRGLMLRLASGWGRTESGTQALWQRQDTRGLAPGQGRGTGSRFSAGWSYGLEVPRSNAVLTPYGGVEMAGRSRRLRLGWRYELGQWLSLSLDGERRETPHARPQHSLMLRTSLPW